MASIKVHGTPFSPATARVLCVLVEKELEYELVPVDLRSGEHKKEPFISINPFGQVPGFEDGELKLFESRAITQYIAHAYSDKGTNLIAIEPKKMALVGTWVEVEAHHFDQPASKLTWELAIKPMFGMGEPDAAVVAENEAKLGSVLNVYEKQLSKAKYLAGDFYSLADLHHVPHLSYLIGTEAKKLFESRPRVNAWVGEILARPTSAKVVGMRVKH